VDSLTPAGRILAAEMARTGPVPFSQFMETALYHPEHGYYRKPHDPFGTQGDFYTAEQLQPVFGRLIATAIDALRKELAIGNDFYVVELGAGRREMSGALAAFPYTPVDIDDGDMPGRFSGVVFSNEFFDALPVDLLARRGSTWFEQRVDFAEGRFTWDHSVPADVDQPADRRVIETQAHRLRWLERIAASLETGFILTIDYGYTRRELIRFPEGTLMSYRRHRALEDVLARPGEQDITAHVDFTALQERGSELGLETVRFESLAQMLLRAGEPDSFASALRAESEQEELRLRMQLKSLLFGMGETFRVLLQRKG
jgi:SAM-dependent MidA family methyltransferase